MVKKSFILILVLFLIWVFDRNIDRSGDSVCSNDGGFGVDLFHSLTWWIRSSNCFPPDHNGFVFRSVCVRTLLFFGLWREICRKSNLLGFGPHALLCFCWLDYSCNFLSSCLLKCVIIIILIQGGKKTTVILIWRALLWLLVADIPYNDSCHILFEKHALLRKSIRGDQS